MKSCEEQVLITVASSIGAKVTFKILVLEVIWTLKTTFTDVLET